LPPTLDATYIKWVCALDRLFFYTGYRGVIKSLSRFILSQCALSCEPEKMIPIKQGVAGSREKITRPYYFR